MATTKKTSLENKHLGNGDYFVITASSSHALLATFRLEYVVDRARCKWTGRSTVEVNIEDERFTIVVCSRCRQRPKSGNFPLSFGRLRQRIVLKYVPHVQHDYFSALNQSDHCSLASVFAVAVILA